jgi:hypothetical protein
MFAPATQIEGGATTGLYAPKKIYVFGGLTFQDGESISTAITRVYDPETDSWSTRSSMPTQRVRFYVAVVDDKLYVIGGQIATENNESSHVYKSENEQYTPIGYVAPDKSSSTPSQESATKPEPFPTVLVVAVSVASAGIIVVGLLVYFRNASVKQGFSVHFRFSAKK